MKKVWMSVLSKNEELAQKLMGKIKSYGLEVDGHFWSGNLEKMEWMGPRANLITNDYALWVIVAGKEELESAEVLFGLSLLAITVQAQRGLGFPIFLLHGDDFAPTDDDLPTPLKHAQIFPASSATAGAKMVARANTPVSHAEADYRIDVYGLPGLGLWVEVGPAAGSWSGVMFGASQGDINAHGVGVKGELPKGKMILNYPMQGLKIEFSGKEYTAWAVKNEIDENSSYFLRVTDVPDSILFGPFSEGDDAEVHVLTLR